MHIEWCERILLLMFSCFQLAEILFCAQLKGTVCVQETVHHWIRKLYLLLGKLVWECVVCMWCVCVHVCARMQASMRVYIIVCVCACMHVCVFEATCIYTQLAVCMNQCVVK